MKAFEEWYALDHHRHCCTRSAAERAWIAGLEWTIDNIDLLPKKQRKSLLDIIEKELNE